MTRAVFAEHLPAILQGLPAQVWGPGCAPMSPLLILLPVLTAHMPDETGALPGPLLWPASLGLSCRSASCS